MLSITQVRLAHLLVDIKQPESTYHISIRGEIFLDLRPSDRRLYTQCLDLTPDGFCPNTYVPSMVVVAML